MGENETNRRFGREMARARKKSGMTQGALARELGVSTSHISNLERGFRSPALSLIPALDEAVGTNYLARLWDELNGDGRPAWLDEITTAIDRAEAVYEYQMLAFPGYLQTEGYARALVEYGAPWLTPDEVSARTAERVDRTRRIEEATRPKLWLVIDGSVLGRRYGGPAVARKQLEYVADMAERGRVAVQMVPTSSTTHPGNSGSFVLVTAHTSPDVVFAESALEGHLVTSPAAASRYRMLYAALQGAAVGPVETLDAIRDELKRIDYG